MLNSQAIKDNWYMRWAYEKKEIFTDLDLENNSASIDILHFN